LYTENAYLIGRQVQRRDDRLIAHRNASDPGADNPLEDLHLI